MIIELLMFTFFGILLGIFTGLIPGLHVNTVALFLLGAAAFIDPYLLAVTIIATAITHTIWDFIPSILLGMPEPGTALSVLPGHRLLMEGRGLEAIYLTVVGGVSVILLSIALLPALLFIIPLFYQNIHIYIHFVLGAIAVVIVMSERGWKKRAYAFSIFMLAGILGWVVLNSFMLPSHTLFFPLFTGLFGLSTLIISLNRGTNPPKQSMEFPRTEKRLAFFGGIKALFSGVLVGTLPGVGAAQATVLTQQITRKRDSREFLVSIGGINTVVALFSLISLYTIFRPRSGAAVAVDQILMGFGANELMLLIAVALVATGISSLLLLRSVKGLVSVLQKISYPKLTVGIMAFLIAMTAILTQGIGLIVLFASTSIGLLAPLLGVKRSNLMGVLMLHLIIFYAGF
jgi:putative membrane protein